MIFNNFIHVFKRICPLIQNWYRIQIPMELILELQYSDVIVVEQMFLSYSMSRVST